MVFPDFELNNPNGGSRYFYGVIRDVFNQIITVEVTESTWWEYQKHSQLFFPKYQVYAEDEKKVVQLSLFS